MGGGGAGHDVCGGARVVDVVFVDDIEFRCYAFDPGPGQPPAPAPAPKKREQAGRRRGHEGGGAAAGGDRGVAAGV